jgi:hypothetical protein
MNGASVHGNKSFIADITANEECVSRQVASRINRKFCVGTRRNAADEDLTC